MQPFGHRALTIVCVVGLSLTAGCSDSTTADNPSSSSTSTSTTSEPPASTFEVTLSGQWNPEYMAPDARPSIHVGANLTAFRPSAALPATNEMSIDMSARLGDGTWLVFGVFPDAERMGTTVDLARLRDAIPHYEAGMPVRVRNVITFADERHFTMYTSYPDGIPDDPTRPVRAIVDLDGTTHEFAIAGAADRTATGPEALQDVEITLDD